MGRSAPHWRCAVCATSVDIGAPFPWRCPRSSPDDRRHVLRIVDPGSEAAPIDDPNPFVRYGPRLAWWASARAGGLSDDECVELTRRLVPDAVTTPAMPSAVISEELGVEVWVKDETRGVAGSHKYRHLATILLQLLAAERRGLLPARPVLAIASCGNAALAAATLAVRVDWPIEVYVPVWMDDAFGDRLDGLGATVTRCPRRAGDPPGDPAVFRFREAVARGAIPFSVQGPENALCLDGGRTLGWELAEQTARTSLDAVFVQVGGGAFATCVGEALGPAVSLHAVQAEGCAPLARAWERAADLDEHEVAERWGELMEPWSDPRSVADGILDDETYDGLGVIMAMRASGGHPVVAPEDAVIAANELARRAGFGASHTGSAGLAGLLAARTTLAPGSRVGVVMSGVAR